MPQPYLLEICCDSYEDALAAQAGERIVSNCVRNYRPEDSV
ncbi:MAG: hypothetical protein R2784_17485 [Saprospiraceae bacterium]